MKESLPSLLQRSLDRHGWQPCVLAHVSGVSLPEILDVLVGTKSCPASKAVLIGQALGISATSILKAQVSPAVKHAWAKQRREIAQVERRRRELLLEQASPVEPSDPSSPSGL
jgi:hypothetical protein